MSVTFEISPVERATAPLEPSRVTGQPGGRPLMLLGRPVEAWGSSSTRPALISEQGVTHGLVATVGAAFRMHYPLVLTPDVIWIAIAQGFALHVKQNAEHLRDKLVKVAPGKPLHVQRDDFVKGSPTNPWPEVFASFSEQIAASIGRQRDLVVCNFSTTGPCERAASEIVLMDAMQSYFQYRMSTMCGIPTITLEGTREDYVSIRRRVSALEEYGLSWWTAALLPVIDRFIAAFDGEVDPLFWRSLFKFDSESGATYVNGWINVFVPYLQNKHTGALSENRYDYEPLVFERERRSPATFRDRAHPLQPEVAQQGPEVSNLPSGFSIAPLAWQYFDLEYAMELLAGFFGVAQDEGTLALRPVIGWAVRDAWPAAVRPPDHDFDTTLHDPAVLLGHTSAEEAFAGWDHRGLQALEKSLEEVMANIRRTTKIDLTYAVLGSIDPNRGAPLRVLVGVPLGRAPRDASLRPLPRSQTEAESELRRVPEWAWSALRTILPGGLSAATGTYLLSAYREVTLLLGDRFEPSDAPLPEWTSQHPSEIFFASDRGSLRGVKVAVAGKDHPAFVEIDMSPAADMERRAVAHAIGLSPEVAYHLFLGSR